MDGSVNIYDKNLLWAGIIDGVTSLIWAKRYWNVGDCEVYVAASADVADVAQIGYYIGIEGDDMICRIDRVELTTDAEAGDYFIIHGTAASVLLDQRIIWTTTTAQGKAEIFARRLVSDALIAPLQTGRIAYKPNGGILVKLGTAAGFDTPSTEQVTYKNLGAKMREICRHYGWGYRMIKDGMQLAFELYAGADHSAEVIFSDEFGNLISTDYTEDAQSIINVALVGGSGEGALRVCEQAGVAESTDRWEIFIDAKSSASNVITWGELKAVYPEVGDGGYGTIVPRAVGYAYNMSQFDVQIFDDEQKLRISNKYPGGIYFCTIDGGCYYRVTNVDIATLDSLTPADTDPVTLTYIAYSPRLVSLGYENIAGHEATTDFEGEIDPLASFEYRTDYDLGDLVKIENGYGISVTVRITEVIEVIDENGYRVEPKFEYQA